MVIALVVLSLAMIFGGLYAALQGWEIVVLERGWSLMIAGSVAAASGALLLGITAAVARLEAIRKEMAHLSDRMSRAELPSVLPPPPSLDPMDAASGGLLSGAGAPGADHRVEEEPSLPLFMRRAQERDEGPPEDDHTPVAPPLPEPQYDAADRPEGTERAYEDQGPRLRIPGYLFRSRRDEEPVPQDAGPLPEPEPRPVPEPARPVEPPTAPASVEPTPAPASAPAGAPPTVVGSYNAGDNRYVMYSDGSIEADTPQGVFRFDSLDELKQFIASGGDKPPTTP